VQKTKTHLSFAPLSRSSMTMRMASSPELCVALRSASMRLVLVGPRRPARHVAQAPAVTRADRIAAREAQRACRTSVA